MDTHQFNTLGGVCELIGVGFVARDLMAIADYRGKLAEWTAWFRTRWAAAVALARRRLGRPQPVERHVALADAATGAGRALGVTTGMRGPFATRPGQSLQDQIDELGSLVNRLRNEVISEPRERERAISAERAARRNELKAEAERLERLIAALRQEVERLDEATTGNLGLRAEGLWWLVAGIVFTTWSELSWLPFRLTAFVVGTIFVARVSWPYWSWLARSQAGRPARRVGCGVLWRG